MLSDAIKALDKIKIQFIKKTISKIGNRRKIHPSDKGHLQNFYYIILNGEILIFVH